MFKIGQKVKPINKSYLNSLDRCTQWRMGEGQGYLYVVNFWKNGYVLNAFKWEDEGSLYCFDDVVEYKESSSKEWIDVTKSVEIGKVLVEPEYDKAEDFLKALEHKDSLLYMSDMENGFVKSLNLTEIKKLHKYFGKVIDYCKANVRGV